MKINRLVPCVLVLLAASSARAAEFTREFSFASRELTLVNLIGEVAVQPAPGNDFQVSVQVRGVDAREDLLEFLATEDGEGELVIEFPVADHREYVYRALDRNSKSTIHFDQEEDSSWLKKLFNGLGSRRIKVKGSGEGLEMWADVTVQVPEGAAFRLRNGVGDIRVGGVTGDLNLDSHSGSVEVRQVEGDVLVDTGSGAVQVVGVRGEVVVDTGSGAVTVEDYRGEKLHLDTGSGFVQVSEAACDDLVIDTGSGGVRATGVAGDRIMIDTGSGGVEVQLASLTRGKVVIDTGSGGVQLRLPADASASIRADTGGGRIESRLQGALVTGSEDDELRLELGDGQARVILDTGSGSITISQD